MDLRLTGLAPSPEEVAAVDAVLGKDSQHGVGPGSMARAVVGGIQWSRQHRFLLLPALHAVQDRVGWISRPALDYVCQRLQVAPAEAYGVGSTYALLSFEQRPPLVLHICDDIACRAALGGDPAGEVEANLGPEGTEAGGFTWARSPCLGHCEFGSACLLQQAGEGQPLRSVAPGGWFRAQQLIRGERVVGNDSTRLISMTDDMSPSLLRRMQEEDPESIDSFIEAGGFAELRRAIDLGTTGVLAEIVASGLVGRGGAAFPTGQKWQAVANSEAYPHYVVCNADESEPGTFKDRVLMENGPFAVVAALTIAGMATRSEHGYIYVRDEYPLARARLSHAIATATEAGFLGSSVLDSGNPFHITVCRGAGAYIAGEETALFNSIEGRRPEPRNKPPFPTQFGLFGKPTVVNNVETLLNVLEIVRIGAHQYASVGTESSHGTRLFCVSGSIQEPGVYECELGLTLRDLLSRAGGPPVGRKIRSVLLGGAAGSFVLPDQFDVRLSMEDTRAAGLTLGSGVVLVFDDRVNMNDIVLRIAHFFRHESCGQCVPCRVGTVRQEELVWRMASEKRLDSPTDELSRLRDLGEVMRDASICGLGQTAMAAIESAVALGLFPDKAGKRSRGWT